ncbi:hypothetical protein [Flavobacterium sp. ZT3R18]|nr:hypothetical protein [Flavobacterium sp. ZT3R18]
MNEIKSVFFAAIPTIDGIREIFHDKRIRDNSCNSCLKNLK